MEMAEANLRNHRASLQERQNQIHMQRRMLDAEEIEIQGKMQQIHEQIGVIVIANTAEVQHGNDAS